MIKTKPYLGLRAPSWNKEEQTMTDAIILGFLGFRHAKWRGCYRPTDVRSLSGRPTRRMTRGVASAPRFIFNNPVYCPLMVA